MTEVYDAGQERSLEEKRELLRKLLLRKTNELQDHSLSHGQRALWFVYQLAPNSAAYNIYSAVRLIGDLDQIALQRAIRQLVARHSALRATFENRGGEPIQRIHPNPPFHFQQVNATTWTSEDLARRLTEEANRPFDLERGPVFRTTLFLQERRESIVLLAMHHITADYWSLTVLLEELIVLYQAEARGAGVTLSSLPARYTDYVDWQRRMLASPEGERHLAYWKKQLEGPLPVLDLATDRPRPPVLAFEGDAYAFSIHEDLTGRLRQLAREEKVTLYTVLVAAYHVLFHRHTNQEDVLIGSPMGGRGRAEFHAVVGHFINPVVLRARVVGHDSFRSFLAQMRTTVLDALTHQEYPFPLLVEHLRQPRDPSRSPLFQVMFNLTKPMRFGAQTISPLVLGEEKAVIDVDRLKMEFFGLEQRSAMFDLLLVVVENPSSLAAAMQFNTDLFDRATIVRLMQHYVTLLHGIVANPDHRIVDLPLLSRAEQRQLLVEWNSTADGRPEGVCYPQLFEEQVERYPDSIAVGTEAEQLTYRSLNSRANILARRLIERGVGPGVVVAVLAERGADLLTAMVSVFKAGGVYLPLDAGNLAERYGQILELSEARVLLLSRQLVAALSEGVGPLPEGCLPLMLEFDQRCEPQEKAINLTARCSPSDVAYVIATSGANGVPQGTQVEHRGMLNQLYAKIADLKLTKVDVVAQTAPPSWDNSIWQFLAALMVGGRTCVIGDAGVSDPRGFLQQIEAEGVSIVETVPSLLQALVAETEQQPDAISNRSPLRWIISTGEALPVDLCRQWLQRFPKIPILNAFGLCECSGAVTHNPIHQLPGPKMSSMPIGRPINNVRIYILDPRQRPVPIGVVGELYVGGVGVGRGYLNDAKRTAATFLPDPYVQDAGVRLYKTGNLARFLADGNVELVGRTDRQVSLRGWRIELGEIEAGLSRHPQVREVVVLAREDAPPDRRLVAYVVPSHAGKMDAGELRRYLKDLLPEFMVPAAFVSLETLPRTQNGTVNRLALPPLDQVAPATDRPLVLPRTPLEEALADIWCNVLGLPQVGVDDDFFAAGGHSLLVVQFAAKVRESFDVQLRLSDFFSARTIAQLAELIQAAKDRGEPVARVLRTTDLASEAVLDPSITVPDYGAAPIVEPSAIFLTGATGLLGAYLLQQLLDDTRAAIYCLVRGKDAATTKQRILSNLREHGLGTPAQYNRIIPVAGDLAQPLLGLSRSQFDWLAATIDAVYHCGALVNFVYPYESLKASNVLGTQEVIRLAAEVRVKPVHHVSTLTVFPVLDHGDSATIDEDASLDHGLPLFDGYSQSKWVADKLGTIARSRGVPVSVYRPGRITGPSQTGVTGTNDLLFNLIKQSMSLGIIPDLNLTVDLTPVDFVSQAIVHLSRQSAGHGQTFHLVNPQPFRWSDLIAAAGALGYPLQKLPFDRWKDMLVAAGGPFAGSGLTSLLSVLAANLQANGEVEQSRSLPIGSSGPRFDDRNARNGLSGTTIECPPAAALLQRYFSYLVRSGFLGDRRRFGADA